MEKNPSGGGFNLSDLALPVLIFVMLFAVYQYAYPAYRMYSNYRNERYELEKKYNRLFKARKDMTMHFDWANSRGDSIDRIEAMGREVERMD